MVNHVSHNNNVMDQYVTKLYGAKFLQFFFFFPGHSAQLVGS